MALRLIAAGMLLAVLLASACGGSSALAPGGRHAAPGLPPLPDDGPAWSKSVSDVTTQAGTQRQTDSIDGITADSPTVGALSMDGAAAGEFAWAIWSFPLTAGTIIESFQITLTQSQQNKYFYAYADYSTGSWQFSEEKFGGTLFTPENQLALHSPGEYAYLAILVGAGNTVNIAQIAMNAQGEPLPMPIFDQFENNDTTQTAWPLEPGLYHASIHDTHALEFPQEEWKDEWDFYRISLLAGQTLTTTLRYEVYDHFDDPELWPPPNMNDLDILFYTGVTDFPLDQFVEQYSSFRIYYVPFEQSVYTAPANQDVFIGIRADIDIEYHVKSNAEYYLGVYVSDAVHTVAGNIKVHGVQAEHDLLVYLEPGNFNDWTSVAGDPEGDTPGHFSISGVPDGEYALKVHSSARLDVPDYVWPDSLPVTVAGGDLIGLELDLDDYP